MIPAFIAGVIRIAHAPSAAIPPATVDPERRGFEFIESYPDDKYLPSYLVHGQAEGTVFHVLFAVDVAGDNVHVVTSYRPDPRDWEEDLKTMRTRP